MFIPGVVNNLPLYILSIIIGVGVTAGALFFLKRPLPVEEAEEEKEKALVSAIA